MDQKVIDALNCANYPSKGNVFATMNDLAITLPYKCYCVLLSQTGTAAPTVVTLQNTIGTIVWARTSQGLYTGTLVGAFTVDKTFLLFQGGVQLGSSTDVISAFTRTSANVVTLSTNGSDDVILKSSIEIRVY